MSKKLEEKQRRREAEERREAERKRAAMRRNLTTLLIALLVAGLVGYLIYNERQGEENIGVADREAAGCTDVERHEEQGREHVDEGTPVEYNTTPPTSGAHYANWSDPGFFEEPVDERRLVHNLEHGQLVIWYNPDAPQSVKDDIQALVNSERTAILAAPYDRIDGSHEFVITGWAASQRCEAVSLDVINAFREEFQGRGPENVGIPTFSGD